VQESSLSFRAQRAMPVHNGIYAFTFKADEPAYPPIVLLHGAGGTHLNWPAELRRLNGYEVHALDLPGHGKSEGHGHQDISPYTEDLIGWMDAVGLFRIFLIGHSLGGMIALQVCLAHPSRVSGLGLISSAARIQVPPDLIENTATSSTRPAALERLRLLSYGPDAGERLIQLGMQRLAETRPSVLHNDLLASNAVNLLDRLEEIRKPALVVCGSEDRLTPLRHSQLLANRIPGADLRVVPGAGHMAILEKPSDVAEITLSFLKENRWRL